MNNIENCNIKFNYHPEGLNTVRCKTGTEVKIVSFEDLNPSKTLIKENEAWIQMFPSGYRESNDTIDWSKWNGCVFVDIDAKNILGKDDKAKEKVTEITPKLHYFLWSSYPQNYLFTQVSNSGSSWHFVFYFNCEKTFINFKKAATYANELIADIFKRQDAQYIIDAKGVMDYCNKKFVQPLYISHYPIYKTELISSSDWGRCNELEDVVVQETKAVEVSDIDDKGDLLISNFKWSDSITATKRIYHHDERIKLWWAVQMVSDSLEEAKEIYTNRIVPYFQTYDHYTVRDFITAPEGAYKSFDPKKTNVDRLREFGFKFDRKFVPKNFELYEPDYIIELKDGEYLSDIKMPLKNDRINHIFAGCGVGKTQMSKFLGSNVDEMDFIFNGKNRVCFITPLNSISKNSFEGVDGWRIIDGDHKDSYDVKGILNNMYNNICTTWESFVLYEMYNINFDYVILDEVHSFYLYDYRVNSIAQIKQFFPASRGIKIMMTGTPSYEVEEFDCFKIQIKRQDKPVKCDVVLYKNSYKGYIMEDIKSWTNDPKHYALIFRDTTNYTTEDDFKMYGLDVDIFNKNYGDNKDYILENNNVKSQITAFSVYAQAGINLYLDRDIKARVYILSNNAMGIIQYANRIRNKEVIDKIVVPYKTENVTSDVVNIDKIIDLDDAQRRLEILKSTGKEIDIFNPKTDSFLKLHYQFNVDCVNWNMMELREKNYTVYKLIKNIAHYEKQLQVIYNRMCGAYFEVNFVELTKDVKFSGDTKMRSNQFAGQMIRFNGDLVKERDGKVYIEPNKQLDKVMASNIKENLNKVLNYIYQESGCDIDKTMEKFNDFIANTIKENETITKSDLNKVRLFYELKNKWNTYYNGQFITLMLKDDWSDIQIAAVYMRTIWNENMLGRDWQNLAEESYQKLSIIREVVVKNREVFERLESEEPSNTIRFENDEILGKINSYLLRKHTRGKRTKEITVKGIEFKSVLEAAEHFNVSRRTINRWIK